MAKRYIAVEDRNPYGDDVDESLLNDPGKDSTYIEGYSDVRRNRELAIRDGTPSTPLKHRLQWARARSFDGTRNDGRRVMHWQSRKGYAPLAYDEALKLGYRVDKNPAIQRGPDGMCYLGEQMLMVADARTAATNLKKAQNDLQAQMEAPQQRMEAATSRFNARGAGKASAFAFVGDDPDEQARHKKH